MTARREERFGPRGEVRLLLGDCREIVPTLGPVDAIISDPPYGIRFVHSGKRSPRGLNTRAARQRGNPPIIGDDQTFDPRWLICICKNVLLWGADHYYARIPDHGRFLAWNKLGDMEPWDSFSDVEFAWHSRDIAARIFNMKWKGIACAKRGENNGQREHPTQKPIALMRWCIDQARLRPGDLILDPYMGSGSTLVAAVQAGHPCIGIEIDPLYFETACRRVSEAMRQPSLPLEPAATPRQSSLEIPT